MNKIKRSCLLLGITIALNMAYSCSIPSTTGNVIPQNSQSNKSKPTSIPQLTSDGKIIEHPEKAGNSSNSNQQTDSYSVPAIYSSQPSQGVYSTPSTATNSTQPSGQTGSTSDTKERATFNGRVYDKNNNILEGATVTARSIDPGIDWEGETQITVGGAYVFRNVPVGARIAITVTKDGITKERAEVLKSNLQGDPTANVFDFSGTYGIGNDTAENGRVAISGKIFDINGNPVNNGVVKVEVVSGMGWSNQVSIINGNYQFDGVPGGAKIKITVTTSDGKVKSREEIANQPNNIFNFGGDNDKTFAISGLNDNFFVDYGVNPYISPNTEKLSTFSIDVDTAAYTWMRKSILEQNALPDRKSVRIEEFINFFDYGYPLPVKDNFTINTDIVQTPVGESNTKVLRIGLQGKSLQANESRKPAVLTFVIDVSGSMDQDNRLGLVKQSLNLLVDNLNKDDKIAIVVFGDNARIVLNSTSADNKNVIKQAINSLTTEGSTNTEAGLLQGFELAGKNFRSNSSNRVILCSDGVANVGNTGPDLILAEIKKRSETGIALSTVGFGMGNYNDTVMEQLANKGDGYYAYVDNLNEAYRVFSENLNSSLQTIAKDVKVQVEFNPETVKQYRLLGYENRAINNQDFRNDSVDAGEVGLNNSVTALYEVQLNNNSTSGKIAEVFLRYKDSNDLNRVKEFKKEVLGSEINNNFSSASPSFKLATSVAMFAEILRHSYWAKDARYADVTRITKEAEQGYDNSKKINEFLSIVDKASKLPTN